MSGPGVCACCCQSILLCQRPVKSLGIASSHFQSRPEYAPIYVQHTIQYLFRIEVDRGRTNRLSYHTIPGLLDWPSVSPGNQSQHVRNWDWPQLNAYTLFLNRLTYICASSLCSSHEPKEQYTLKKKKLLLNRTSIHPCAP